MHKNFTISSKTYFFVFLIITIMALFICRNIEFGESRDNRYTVFSIRFEYFGMDASEIERIITIPLEEKLAASNDLYEIRSVAEYGKTTTSLYFSRTVNQKNTYLALRDIVDTLYASLPQAVQKPRIYFTGSEQKSFLSIACMPEGSINELRKYIENTLKKDLERVDGVAEVIIAGGAIDEIRIEFDPDKAAKTGINPSVLGTIVQDANVVGQGGILHGYTNNVNVILNTKIRSLDQIKHIPVKAGDEITSLEYFADINLSRREADEIVRINGRECIGVQIKAASSGSIIKLSDDCKQIIRNSSIPSDAIQILSDAGEMLLSMIKTVLLAMLQSFIILIIIIPFFYKTLRVMLLLIFLLPANCVWSIAILHLLGLSIDQNVLSGITISLGLIIDSPLIIGNLAEKYTQKEPFKKSVAGIMNAVVISTVTTICVVVPLYFLDYIVPGIKSVSVTISVMMINSLILTCFFFPSFVFSDSAGLSVLPSGIFNQVKRFYRRMAFRISMFSVNHRIIMRGVYVLCIISTFILFFISAKNINLETQDNIIFAAVEYEPERTGISIDGELAEFTDRIRNEYGVSFLRVESRNGTAEFEIGFNDELISRNVLANKIISFAPYIKTGFLYVPDSGGKSHSNIQEIEIAVAGDESAVCREIARTGASAVQMAPGVIQTVLNFKNPERTVNFIPNRDVITKSALTVQSIASNLRWLMFGPVVDKWIQNGEETDIRVIGKNLKNTTLSRLTNLYIPSESGGIRINTLGSFETFDGTGKIYRRDGRRAAYFTAHVNTSGSNNAAAIVKNALASLETAKGYVFLLPRELELLEKQYRLLLFAFIGSIAAILLVLTALTENIIESILICSIIPVSCVLPLFIKYITAHPLEMGDITGMVIISGISVNNAIYIAESAKSNIFFKIREKIQSILVTSLTSIAASIPLALTGSGGFSATLAFSILLGTMGSMAVALVLFPAVFVCRWNSATATTLDRRSLSLSA
jgi:multidrug efflux pump subunit AcrB